MKSQELISLLKNREGLLSSRDSLQNKSFAISELQDTKPSALLYQLGNHVHKEDEGVSHVAPQAKMVPNLMSQLFKFLKDEKGLSWLIKACVFHYELEFIHPFSDGNGRMGRLWQQLLLMNEDKIFKYLPIESLIKQNQFEYYKMLSICDKQGESTLFIEFMLDVILETLKEYSAVTILATQDHKSRLQYAQELLAVNAFSRKDYILLHKDISSATASRDLKWGLKNNILTSKGKNNQTRYSFK